MLGRRNAIKSSLLVSATASAALIAACATGAVTPEQSKANAVANATKVVQVAQAGLTTLTTELRIFNVTLTGNPLTAYNALQAAVASLPSIATTDATAVATFATAPTTNITQLLTDAATLILAVLRVVPGTSNAVGLVEDVIAMAPLVTALAQLILAPVATAAPTSAAIITQSNARKAASRLGVTL